MSIGLRTKIMLWGRAASRCAFPECKLELVNDATETDDESFIGDIAHIVAQSPDGPRGDPNFPAENLDKYSNLILLCKNHHKMVDDQNNKYSVQELQRIKLEHERFVKNNLSFNAQEQQDHEIYASYLDTFNKLANKDNWNGWTSYIISSSSSRMTKEHYNNLVELRNYLFNRIWPKRYLELEEAFLNFRLILNDFLLVFDKYKIDGRWDGWYFTEKFYKIKEWDNEKYTRLLKLYNYHEDLIADFICELTKACNYTDLMVRKYLLSNYRLDEGVLLITRGPTMEGKDITYRLEYDDEEIKTLPYQGLKNFMALRETRNVHFGIGVSDNYTDAY